MPYAVEGHDVWKSIRPRENRGGFVPAEFNDPWAMDAGFLLWLHDVRIRAGVPLRIISDARAPDGHVGAELSAHKKRPCKAVDVQVRNNHERYRIIMAAVLAGCTRIGVYPAHEDGSGSLHIDREEDAPQEVTWTRF